MSYSSDLSSQLSRVEEKISRLRRLDRGFTIFGASSHRYRLNKKIPDQQISDFEKKHKISLPLDYRCFIRFLGNGGDGPFYGLGSLENGIFGDMDSRYEDYVIDLAAPFPYSESWNLDSKDFDDDHAFEEEYFKRTHINGLLRLCNFGCGVFINLVVCGAEYGKMWTDDRINSSGIYPSIELGNEDRISFIEWYELWLDNSIGKF